MRAGDRAYMSEAIGWNYKLPEVCSALARVKLRNLNDYLEGTQENAAALTDRLSTIAGLITPRVPPERTHAYYLYPLKVDPAPLNLDTEPGRLKNAVLHALIAENVRAGIWQKVPIPAQPLFQKKEDAPYDLTEYPNSFSAIESGFTVRGLVPPNGSDLVDAYADAFEKVFQNIDRVLAIYDKNEKYIPVEKRIADLSQAS
jgi:dTDP-4-amino-4,6-dideoxygalactose transaminase